MRPLQVVLSLLALTGAVATGAVAQRQARSPEVQRLSFYVGRWSETGRMREDPAKPFKPVAGGETCRWAAGGSAVLCEEKTAGQGGGWEGVYILSYDAASKQYHVHGTEAPGNDMHAVGRLEGERWTWVTDAAPDGSRARYTFAPAGGGARTMNVEVGSGQRWAPIVEITYTPRR